MPDNDVFGKTPDAPAQSATLEALVGPGKKFATVEDLAKGKAEADAFIENLKQEQAALRAELAQKLDGAEQLAGLRAELEALKQAKAQGSKDNNQSPLTVDGIKALVNETITQTERNRTSQQNITEANSAMVTHFGSLDKAAEAVQAKAAELGLSVDDLKEMASKSPSAFKKIVLGEQAKGAAGPLDVASKKPDSAAPAAGTQTPGTKEYFEAIRKSNPREYWTPKVQMALHEAVAKGTYQLT